jgi:hypothetical protein
MESGSLSLDEVKTLTHDVFLLTKMSQGRREEIVGKWNFILFSLIGEG